MAPRGDVSLQDALDSINSGTVKARGNGLDDLIFLLDKKSKAVNLADLADKHFHRVFEAIFKCVVLEKTQGYYSGKKTTATAATARLSKCAEALRLAVQHGSVKIKRKTILAVIDHITQTLPDVSAGGLIKPLEQDYLKALVTLFAHQANAETLATSGADGWLDCLDFCLDILATALDNNAQEESSGSRASPAPVAFSLNSTASRSSALSANRLPSQLPRNTLQDLLHVVYLLLSPANAPIAERSERVANVLLKILSRRHNLSQITLHAFASLNILFLAVQTDDLKLSKRLACEMVPLLSNWWQGRTVSQDHLQNLVRDEMLKSIIHIHLHLERVSQDDHDILDHVEQLAETLWSEYTRRDERAQLHLDDLTFTTSVLRYDWLRIQPFGLRPHHQDGERKWSFLQGLAFLEYILWRGRQGQRPQDDEIQHLHPRKRQRTSPGAQRIRSKLQDLQSAQTALQLIPFLLQLGMDSVDVHDDVAMAVGTEGTWALLAYGCLVLSHEIEGDTWKSPWRHAVRAISLPSTCRAASFLLRTLLESGCVPYHSVVNDITSIVTNAHVNGPSILADSSVQLMMLLQSLRNTKLPSASQQTSQHVIRWAFFRWTPTGSTYATTSFLHIHPVEFANLLLACCGADALSLHRVSLSGSSISQAWCDHQESTAAIRYLLLLPESSYSTDDTPVMAATDFIRSTDATSYQSSKKLILDFLVPKLDELKEMCLSWTLKASEGGSQMSPGRAQNLLSACTVSALLEPQLCGLNAIQSRDVEPRIFELIGALLTNMSGTPDSKALYELLLQDVASHLPPLHSAGLQHLSRQHTCLLRLYSKISTGLADRVEKEPSGQSSDFMELDDEFESQESRFSTALKPQIVPRHVTALRMSCEAFYHATTVRVHLLSLLHHSKEQIDLVPTELVEYVTEMTPEVFLLSCDAISELVNSDLLISAEDALKVIDKLGEVMSEPEYTCCEVAHSVILDIIRGLSSVWLDEKNEEVSSAAKDMYHHFVGTSLPKKSLSPKSQIALSQLLFCCLRNDPQYGTELHLPSCRTTLLSVLQEGVMSVKYHIAIRLPEIFGLYILKTHDDVFVDVLDSLPTDGEVLEGIAFRLLVLAELACHWPTLLRRCTYHIFEVPGKLPMCTDYATRCLSKVSSALDLKSAKNLFELFSPQLLFTWLEEERLEDMPFQIFNFATLREMLQACRGEAASLMLMRGQEEKAKTLAQELCMPLPDMIKAEFSRIMAYAIAQDLSSSATGPDTAEGRIRRILGKEPFLDAVYVNFADIVATLLDVFDQENQIERYLAKDPNFAYAASAMDEIRTLSHSDVVLPVNQQPMFKAKFLLRELFHLCNKTEYELPKLWTPALVVAVARRLFNTIHPALGSLHACSALRKVRVLVCLAGPVVFEQYPLEMLLHSIRPLMVDSECADDALGVSQYLISHGSPYLKQAPSFLAGYGLSTLASLRVFLESSQSSTTQESQFKATMSKAQKFHGWLANYLKDYDSRQFADETQRESFKVITQTAANIRSSGNAERDTNESTLLLEILRDEARSQRLLNEPARELALGLLCGAFVVPVSARSDVISTDELAIKHSSMVWESCRTKGLSEEYLSWAGRVMGRSFAASGEVQPELLRESTLAQYRQLAPGSNASEEGLVALLQRLATSKESIRAGLAESALRAILSEAVAQEDELLVHAAQKTLTESLYNASNWQSYRTPVSDTAHLYDIQESELFSQASIKTDTWVRQLAAYLVHAISSDILLSCLGPVVLHATDFAEHALPFIVHLALSSQMEKTQNVKRQLSEAFRSWLEVFDDTAVGNQKHILNTLLYLRTQEYPNESSIADRCTWLEVNYNATASTAARCGMHKSALLFTEIGSSQLTRASRRTSTAREEESADVLLQIYENIDDPDTYYGLSQPPSLSSVLARSEYEKDGATSLAFRAAEYQDHICQESPASHGDGLALVSSLSTLGLAGLAQSLLTTLDNFEDNDTRTVEDTFGLARRLGIWNLPTPASSKNHAATLYKAFQGIQQATAVSAARQVVYDGYSCTMRSLASSDLNAAGLRKQLGALAVLTEIDDVINAVDFSELESILKRFEGHSQWMHRGRFENVSSLLSCRGTTLNLFSRQAVLRSPSGLSTAQAMQIQIRGLLNSSDIYRYHRATQESLNLATSLTSIATSCEQLDMNVDAVVRLETAKSLWDFGEMIPSIRMLQAIDDPTLLKKQTIPVARSELLSKIGHQVSIARLEKPHDIQKKYLEPALKELKGKSEGNEAGKVLHQFAMFCDDQLQNSDGLEDLARLQNLRRGKSDEVAHLKVLLSAAKDSQTRQRYSSHLAKAQQWLNLDEQELRRVEQTRGEFVRLSLENYLLSLAASDEYNNDALRFTAIWLERSDEELTNDAVRKYLDKVPTRKFATLMNQLSSRLQDQATSFQSLLMGLVRNICVDHPYHGMYHIWSGTKTKANDKDDIAIRRQRATDKVSKHLQNHAAVGGIWHAIDRTSGYYHRLAADRDPNKYKAGHKINLKDTTTGNYLINALIKYRIPPPTMQLELSADCDYSKVPTIAKLEPQMSIASGVSAPKIITAVGSDGHRYRQLVKGGSDDLRQDAIMEQVFAAVSSLLKLHRETQQRNLGIRTYKVLPLTASSGLIEFVPNTIPLHEFLMPAHERYYPKDLKGSQCRKEISNAQGKSTEARLNTYKKVKERFHPVMKFFFLEYFVDPDEWFVKRTAYTRTTAAISMLGHVLGLGDRHGHNILLDHKTGEVVHIDLGVAFEMGRVLPVPELVPFRLTRDIEDGMGITKTEGVFRRCCEFTLDAMREETYSIMTILDVLRYDPLYSWSISPVRLAKLQDANRALDEAEPRLNKNVNEPSEADRALEVVRKKLSKTLSVEATVNDLINQASDERNLAVLYSGWAAYA